MENVIEVRYAGVVVGRSTKVRDWNDAGAFIGFAEPLPSGTPLVLRGDGVEQAARVVEVIESADAGLSGMRVTFAGGQDQLKGRIIRITHLGYVGTFDVVTALAALELALRGFDAPIELGRGVGAAEAILAEGLPPR